MKKFFIKDLATWSKRKLQRSFTSECQIVDRGWPALAGPYAQ